MLFGARGRGIGRGVGRARLAVSGRRMSSSVEDGFRATADWCDKLEDKIRYVDYMGMRDFGGKKRFQGGVATVRCLEDNSKVKQVLAEPGKGRVLVVHAGGCLTRAVVGDMIAASAIKVRNLS